MKKKSITSALVLCLILLALPVLGQRVSLESDQAKGAFQVMMPDGSPIDVWYSFAPAGPDNLLLQFMPQSEFILRAHIVDRTGAEVLQIPTETVSLRYANSVDIAKLAPGNYFVEIYNNTDPEKSHRIPFRIGTK